MTAVPQVVPAFAPALAHLETVLRGLRTSRASPGLVENLEVSAYGGLVRVKDLATTTTTDARTIQIDPWDNSQVPTIAKALETSPIGVTPQVAGTVIRLVLPPLTEERRRELTKLVRQHVEEARVSIRSTRERLVKELRGKKERGELSEDAFERERKKLQADVDAAAAAVDARGREKEQEVLGQ